MYQQIRKQIYTRLEHELSTARLQHVRRVEETACQLSRRHGVDSERVCLAAAAHDLAREWSPERLIRCAATAGEAQAPLVRENPLLLHGPCAARVLQSEYGIRDAEVLAAVRHHTLGAPGLGPVGQVLYIADYIEPGRSGLDPALLYSLQTEGLRGSCVLVIEDQQRRFGDISPQTQQFYAWLRGF